MRIHKTVSGGIRFASLPRCGLQEVLDTTLRDMAEHVSLSDDAIVFNTEDGPVEFEIVHPPGRHCLTCGEQLPGLGSTAELEAENAQACIAHVATHGKKAETSEKWPHGYRHRRDAYLCKAKDTELNQKLIAATRDE